MPGACAQSATARGPVRECLRDHLGREGPAGGEEARPLAELGGHLGEKHPGVLLRPAPVRREQDDAGADRHGSGNGGIDVLHYDIRDRYAFEEPDRYVEFGVRNGMFVVGHTLVWHSQTPKWVFYSDTVALTPVSREGALVLNNLLLSAVLGIVLVGTLYPLIVEAISGEKLSVGPPYFNTAAGPLAPLARQSRHRHDRRRL